ncbi:glycosyltransferase [Chryseobacterium sp. LAM-KRS1]|uniref:glycosyltransferase n=1 Tax=Chryseobacterium sp. LAM-KRS1 TaxID=2715754 RepID=UPI0015575803|nr:glycosyltransferase [Chryseobacterium sp. LAM-KRS1]
MKEILIFTDPFKGNIIPTIGIGEQLTEMGNNIHYIGVPDVTDNIAKTSFSYTTIFEEYYPRGMKHESGKVDVNVIASIIKGDFDEFMKDHNPSAIIFTAYNPIEAITFYIKYQIKTFLVYCHFPMGNDFSKNSFTDKVKEWSVDMLMKNNNIEAANILIDFLIKQGYKITSLRDLISIFDHFQNLMTSSKDFLIEEATERDNDFYIGPCIPQQDIFGSHYDTSGFKKDILKKRETGRNIIYCSLGSWADQIDKNKAQTIIDTVINAMEQSLLENYVIYISAGNLYENYANYSSDRVIIHKWLPQVTILEYTDIAILHGGMGGIKECVMNEIPMIVIPLGLDQFENADRIEKNGLGAKINAHSLNMKDLASIINETQNDKNMRLNLTKMKSSFEQASKNTSYMTLL